MLQNEKAYIKKKYQEDSFNLKDFFSSFNYRNSKEALSTLKKNLYDLKPLVRPKGIGPWADELLSKVDQLASSDELREYWEEHKQKCNRNQIRENALLEEAVYLSTRKRTLESMLSEDVPAGPKEINDAEISFISTSTDTEFVNNSQESEIIPYERYILCFDELTKAKADGLKDENVQQYDANLFGFEDILLISSINFQETESYAYCDLEADELSIIQKWTRACNNKCEFNLLPKSMSQMKLISPLFVIHHNIIKQMPDLTRLKNNEEEFKLKHVFPLLELVFHEMVIRCDVASQAYRDTDTSLFAIIRPDFLIMNGETELVAVEVKPFNGSPSLVEADEIRVAELTKKLLHRRMAKAKSTKEFSSFGIAIAGDNINLYKHDFENGKYTYQKVGNVKLPTMAHTFTHMTLTLEALFTFRKLIEATLPTEDDLLKPYMSNVMNNMKPTTLYLL
ncbi:hypothetical protein BDF21DRAFT_469106 [Thamnidium elegans]|nr:hypothetical protein BDF21DRAFT_469106 [Thamnidium elegans]